MDIKNTYISLARYHVWVTKTLLESINKISDDDYKKDINLFFKSIHGTVNHLLLTDKVWYGRFQHNPFAIESLAQELIIDRNELKEQLIAQTERWEPFIDSLQDDIFESDLVYKDTKGVCQKTNFAITLNHVFNHATHHRGQITTGIKQLGYELPVSMDLVYFIRL